MRDLLRTKLGLPPNCGTSGGASASKTSSTVCRASTICGSPCRRAVSFGRTAPGRHWRRQSGGIQLGHSRRRERAGARPMAEEWVCPFETSAPGPLVPFFFKQWGGVRKSAAGRMLDGKTYDQYPHRVRHPVLGTSQCAAMVKAVEATLSSEDFVRTSDVGSPAILAQSEL